MYVNIGSGGNPAHYQTLINIACITVIKRIKKQKTQISFSYYFTCKKIYKKQKIMLSKQHSLFATEILYPIEIDICAVTVIKIITIAKL